MKRLLMPIALCWFVLLGSAIRTTVRAQPYDEGDQPPSYGDDYGDEYDQGYSPADEPDQDFYDALAPYGDWIQDNTYGWVWHPTDVPDDWEPYTYGQWIWTDLGWTWDSDEEWGWAPFHYGRWFLRPSIGWCWVPGGNWAPAWVAWREGGDWVGWCPLPPDLRWRVGIGFGYVNWDRWGYRRGWNFCRVGDLPGREIHRRLLPRAKTTVFFRSTRNVTSYGRAGVRIANHSLGVARVRAAYGHDIRRYQIAESARPGRRLERDRFYVYRPRLEAGRRGPPRAAVRGPVPERRLAPAERGRDLRTGRYGGGERRRFEERGRFAPPSPRFQRPGQGEPRGRQPAARPARRAPTQKGAPSSGRGGEQRQGGSHRKR